MNGYTPTTPIETRLANLAAQLQPAAVMDAAARSNGDVYEMERFMTAAALWRTNARQTVEQIALDLWGEIDYQAADARDLYETQESARF